MNSAFWTTKAVRSRLGSTDNVIRVAYPCPTRVGHGFITNTTEHISSLVFFNCFNSVGYGVHVSDSRFLSARVRRHRETFGIFLPPRYRDFFLIDIKYHFNPALTESFYHLGFLLPHQWSLGPHPTCGRGGLCPPPQAPPRSPPPTDHLLLLTLEWIEGFTAEWTLLPRRSKASSLPWMPLIHHRGPTKLAP